VAKRVVQHLHVERMAETMTWAQFCMLDRVVNSVLYSSAVICLSLPLWECFSEGVVEACFSSLRAMLSAIGSLDFFRFMNVVISAIGHLTLFQFTGATLMYCFANALLIVAKCYSLSVRRTEYSTAVTFFRCFKPDRLLVIFCHVISAYMCTFLFRQAVRFQGEGQASWGTLEAAYINSAAIVTGVYYGFRFFMSGEDALVFPPIDIPARHVVLQKLRHELWTSTQRAFWTALIFFILHSMFDNLFEALVTERSSVPTPTLFDLSWVAFFFLMQLHTYWAVSSLLLETFASQAIRFDYKGVLYPFVGTELFAEASNNILLSGKLCVGSATEGSLFEQLIQAAPTRLGCSDHAKHHHKAFEAVMKRKGAQATKFNLVPQAGINTKVWRDVQGDSVRDLTQHSSHYPNAPDDHLLLNSRSHTSRGTGMWFFENVRNSGVEMTGYFSPPTTGEHSFIVTSGGGAAELFCGSSPETCHKIAWTTGESNRRGDWLVDGPDNQCSRPFMMRADSEYFIKVIQKTGNCEGGFVSVGVQLPDRNEQVYLPARMIHPARTACQDPVAAATTRQSGSSTNQQSSAGGSRSTARSSSDHVYRALAFLDLVSIARFSPRRRLDFFRDQTGEVWQSVLYHCTAVIDALTLELQLARAASVAHRYQQPQPSHTPVVQPSNSDGYLADQAINRQTERAIRQDQYGNVYGQNFASSGPLGEIGSVGHGDTMDWHADLVVKASMDIMDTQFGNAKWWSLQYPKMWFLGFSWAVIPKSAGLFWNLWSRFLMVVLGFGQASPNKARGIKFWRFRRQW
jgi:hypothetical protein